MKVQLKPSDLQYKYPRDIQNRDTPKFSGKPDNTPFDRDDLFEVLPMFTAVMNQLETDQAIVLYKMEELLNHMPGFINTREEVFDYLLYTMQDLLE